MVAVPSIVERAPTSRDVAALVDLVHDVLRSSLRRLHPTLGAAEITVGQFWALHTVSTLETASLSSVARNLGVSAPTVCANVDQLEAAGLVVRHRSEQDRRAVALSLTPRGRKIEAHVRQEIDRVMAEAAQHLSPADLATTVRVFRELHHRLEAGPSGPRERA